jgi:uncharacterized membrane protein YfcA
MNWNDWAYPAAVLLTAYVVLGITGFGSALIVVPLLARQWPLPEVVALAILLDVPASMLHGGLNLQHVRWTEIARLLPGMAVGAGLGLWLLTRLDSRWPLLVLGAYVVGVGWRALRSPQGARAAPAHWSHGAGLLIGLIDILFATAGPVVVAWLQRRLGDVAALRASVPVAMVLAGAMALPLLAASAQVNLAALMPRWGLALPLALAGVLLGNRLAARVPTGAMKRLVAVLLMASGAALMARFAT